jgi:hypothetical protein
VPQDEIRFGGEILQVPEPDVAIEAACKYISSVGAEFGAADAVPVFQVGEEAPAGGDVPEPGFVVETSRDNGASA